MTVRWRTAVSVLALVLTTGTVGCGTERPTLVASDQSPPTSADEQRDPVEAPPTTRVIADCAAPRGCLGGGWSDFIHESVGAVVGTVESVTQPRWNQESGQPWDGDLEDHPGNPLAGEMQYREATLRVEEVLFRDPGETFVAGDTIVVRVTGDGSPTGVEYAEGFYFNHIDGPITVGSRVLWVLDRQEFQWKERVEYPLGLASFRGNWRIDGDTAVNRLPERTVPADALTAAIKREASSPHRPGDPRGTKNPLE